MLDSLVAAPTPTRAETSNVATAIYDGADAVILSAESATEISPRGSGDDEPHHRKHGTAQDVSFYNYCLPETAPHAVAAAAVGLAAALHASAIAAFTSSGTTAARIAPQTTGGIDPRGKAGSTGIPTPLPSVGAYSLLPKDVDTYEKMEDRMTLTASPGNLHSGQIQSWW